MSNKNNKAVKDAAQIIYGEVMQIIDTHVIHENPATDPRIDPSCLEALCCELDAHFTDKYGVDTQRKPLNAYTWDEIKAIADAGKVADVFKIGDEKQLALYTGETVTLVILGFNHDRKADGSGKAAITFGTKDLIDGEYEMNEITTDDEDDYGSNVGGWCKSKMRNVYMRRLFTLLPPDLQNVITPVEKMTGAGGGSNELYKSIDDLFLFSCVEVDGDESYVANGEGVQYDYYKNPDNIVKSRRGRTDWWWLRSPNVGVTAYFRAVNTTGLVRNYSASSSNGVSFGFCI